MMKISDKLIVHNVLKEDSEIILVSYDEYYNEAFNVGYTWNKFNDN